MSCVVKISRNDTIAMRLYWNGKSSWEGTGLPPTKENIKLANDRARQISREIKAGRFDDERYRFHFPNGNRIRFLGPIAPTQATLTPTLAEYFDVWILRKRPPLFRVSLARDYRQHFKKYILDETVRRNGRPVPFRDLMLSELRTADLRDLQSQLLARGLKVKTVRNAIDGSFRAMIRDARKDELINADVFAALDWPRGVFQETPDPFLLEEQGKLVGWFRTNRPREADFVEFQFKTGLRPSEATALRWGCVDTLRGTIEIRRSRHLGNEDLPKTRASQRVIPILPDVVRLLRDMKPLHVDADDYVFRNKNGAPIDQSEFSKYFWRLGLRGTGLRPRKFYATRHSFLSIALTGGVNLKMLAEYCGTSVAMIERSYGKFLVAGEAKQMQLLAEAFKPSEQPAAKEKKTQKRFRVAS